MVPGYLRRRRHHVFKLKLKQRCTAAGLGLPSPNQLARRVCQQRTSTRSSQSIRVSCSHISSSVRCGTTSSRSGLSAQKARIEACFNLSFTEPCYLLTSTQFRLDHAPSKAPVQRCSCTTSVLDVVGLSDEIGFLYFDGWVLHQAIYIMQGTRHFSPDGRAWVS